MSGDWNQKGITTSGREPVGNGEGAVETPDFLEAVTATGHGNFPQPSGDPNALNHQDAGGND